ncbi:hypothetical protein [Xylanimonas sp. McL0601]|uniref:hypothetical protein n=1 Tax=Xylanimonas sp. McL0601 TaxID=3414739 RepID=UPI003CE8BB00
MNASTRVRAGAPLPVVVREAHRSGWGELRGREHATTRAFLLAMSEVADPRSGDLTTTAHQTAERLGVHPRTAQRALARMVELGLLVQTRRGGRAGDLAVPSRYRIVKGVLLALVRGAREALAARTATYLSAARERTTKLRGLLPNTTGRRTFFPSGKNTTTGAVTRPVSRLWEAPECEHGTPGGSPATCALCRRH